MKKLHSRRGGFTLIELMIVVAIIGILAAIAIPNFLRFQLKARSSEGKTNLAAIRTAQEAYFAEFGAYISATASPPNINLNQKTNYSVGDGLGFGFDIVGWEPEGDVYFNYATQISVGAGEFLATAAADIDADGTPQYWGYRTEGGGGLAAQDHNVANTCVVGNLVAETVMACDSAFGQSEF